MWLYQDGHREKTIQNMEERVKQDGYRMEKYTVTTKDGYINTMYRIHHGKNDDNNNRLRPPVLICHGMVCNSSMFVNGNCLAYYLVDNGFDVWLPNHRGTNFSMKHTDFDEETEKEKYWNFGFQELAVYDLAAFIDTALEHAGQEKIHFIGFSQGCTVFAILNAVRPEYNDKINLCLFYGCPIIFENCSFFTMKLNIYGIVLFVQLLKTIFGIKLYQIPLIKLFRYYMTYAEKNTLANKLLEYFTWFVIGYKDTEQFEKVHFPTLSLTGPDSSSIRQILHYGQMLKYKRFAHYDFGTKKNLELYGTEIPPLYDLSKVTAPVVVFYGKNDMYNNYSKDKLKEKMGNIVHEHIIDHDNYNHIDFIFAKDNIDLLYCHTVKYMKKYCREKNKFD